MKKETGWLLLAVVLGIGLGAQGLQAQLEENIGTMTKENLEGYLGPLNTGLSATMNSAIFRTGHVPAQGLTFSIGAAAMAIGYDDEDRLYTPSDPPGFESQQEGTEVPTVVGDPEGRTVQGQQGLTWHYPGGFDLEGFEIAVPQVSIGSIVGTRAVFRYIALDLGDTELGDFSYIGFGGQHSITQWIPSLPVNVAAGVFVQKFEVGDVVTANAMHWNLTASREFGILQPYAGLGFDTLELNVDYDDEDDPESSFDFDLESESDPHFTLGLMAKVPGVGVFFEFNAAAATGFALGVDFGL
ncbi:MAG: hypothetical protein GF355_14935 [Candidatus Eisenbacteria bacterium]|nr:hypothetical protein [Candidatus Eisenbacteria bacterium]